MSENITRRGVLKNLAGIVGGILAMPAGRTCKAAVQNVSRHLPRRPKAMIRSNTNGSWPWTWTGASAAVFAWKLAARRTVCRKAISAPGLNAT